MPHPRRAPSHYTVTKCALPFLTALTCVGSATTWHLVTAASDSHHVVGSWDTREEIFIHDSAAHWMQQPPHQSISQQLPQEQQQQQQQLPAAHDTKFKIFTYWDYPQGPSSLVSLNVESWRRHAPEGTEVVMINDTNFQQYVPDAPSEWSRLPYAAAKSDVVRASVLYHHGGLYIDTDFLVLHSLETIYKKLEDGWDIVAYTDADGITGDCVKDRFSSNFIAAKKGNKFSETWWHNLRVKLTRTCGRGEYEKEKICCHEEFAKEPETRKCHIPWGFLEHLKNPGLDADARGQRNGRAKQQRSGAKGDAFLAELPPGVRMLCFAGSEGMAPHLNGEIFWQPWDHNTGATLPALTGKHYDTRFMCKSSGQADLDCLTGNWGNQRHIIPQFFNRLAYHLFFSSSVTSRLKAEFQTREEVLQGSWLISEMYRRSLDYPAPRLTLQQQVLPALQSIPSRPQATGTAKYHIYTYWDYPSGAPTLVELNVKSWKLHAPPGTEVVLVNDSNIRDYVPDTPEEYFRLPYAAAKSDFIRAAVLYHNGGIYMDTDFLVMRSLGTVLAKLDEGWDIVAYSDLPGDVRSGSCAKTHFSSNFMAAKKGNSFSKTWWENVKFKLTRVCGEGEMMAETICCHEAFAKEPEQRKCHIPWAFLEHLKYPPYDADVRSVRFSSGAQQSKVKTPKNEEEKRIRGAVERGKATAQQLPADVRLYCFSGSEGMAAHLNGEMYWQAWDPKAGATTTARLGTKFGFESRFDCKYTDSGDISCLQGTWGKGQRVFYNFFGRTAYHLFFSTHKEPIKRPEQMLQGRWLLSEMYRRALQVGNAGIQS